MSQYAVIVEPMDADTYPPPEQRVEALAERLSECRLRLVRAVRIQPCTCDVNGQAEQPVEVTQCRS